MPEPVQKKAQVKSLKALGSEWADSARQNARLSQGEMIPFQQKLEEGGMFPYRPVETQIFQVNVGKMCNQVCKHCHVDAGPDRKEIMTWETMQQCLDVLARHPELQTVDLTGGAPEMNPHFRSFVIGIRALGRHVIVRCNLTIIVANKKYHDLPEFFRHHGVEVVSSLPSYSQDRTDKQRGDGVFEDSIRALKMLNAVGYGMEGMGLKLNLVYNPAGAFLPPAQAALEAEYKTALAADFGIHFNNLFAITNLPISRYLTWLLESGNYEKYMQKLIGAYNPAAAASAMCRNTVSVGWDGYLYDCDFNQMLELKVACGAKHISQWDKDVLAGRSIMVGQHCYGCTAGAGSSCGGATA